MNCRESLEQISAAMDGELSAQERRELELHLDTCPECRALRDTLMDQSAALRALDCQPPADLAGRILAALPPQETAKRGKVLHWKGWVSAAACVVVVAVAALALPGRLLGGSGAKSANMAPMPQLTLAAPDCAEGVSPSECSLEKGADMSLGDTVAVNGLGFGKSTVCRVCYGTVDEYPQVTVLDSLEHLRAYLAQFPDDLSALEDTYGEGWFDDMRLLAVLVDESSGSNRVELAGISPGSVLLDRYVPEIGTADMAAWLLLAEVDLSFETDQSFTVEYCR